MVSHLSTEGVPSGVHMRTVTNSSSAARKSKRLVTRSFDARHHTCYLTESPKTLGVWLLDNTALAQSRRLVPRRFEPARSTPHVLPGPRFSTGTRQRVCRWKGAGPQPGLPRECPCPPQVYIRRGCEGFAVVGFPRPARAGGLQPGHMVNLYS